MSKSIVYTRTGDKGLTSLVGGVRVPKYSLRLDAYGSIDELSAFIGFLAAWQDCEKEIKIQLQSIQNMLFNLGAYLATLPDSNESKVNGLQENDLINLETRIDEIDAILPPLKHFILPGGNEGAARAGLARTVCRRAERRIIELASKEYVDPLLISYVNRLSDYFFVLGRYFNHQAGVEEIIWKQE